MMSEKMRGENNPFYGRKLTESEKSYLSEINSGERHPQFGTHQSEYTKDKIRQKGNKSENRYNVKISWDDVNKIRAIYAEGIKIYELANIFKIHWNTVSDIIKGGTWKVKGYCPNDIEISHTNSRDGKSNRASKLTLEQIKEICEKYATGLFSMTQLAKKFNISQAYVSKIIKSTKEDL